ncbi:MAG: signal peptidase I [Clostridiaceae bacterium]
MDNYLKVLILLVAFIAMVIVTRRYVVFITKVTSLSMSPTLKPNDLLVTIVVHSPKSLKRGDILTFHSEEAGNIMIKRLIGLPGEEVKIDKVGAVYIDGNVIEEKYLGSQGDFYGSFKVPEGEYFFLGDNRKYSKDSRYWSKPTVRFSDITGKVIFPRK